MFVVTIKYSKTNFSKLNKVVSQTDKPELSERESFRRYFILLKSWDFLFASEFLISFSYLNKQNDDKNKARKLTNFTIL